MLLISDKFNYEVISAFYTKIKNLIESNLSYIWGANVFIVLPFKRETQPATTTVGLTIGMRNIITVPLYMSFTSALVLIHINVYAWYLSSNQSLPIWVISPNWTSEQYCNCLSSYTRKLWYLTSPLAVR